MVNISPQLSFESIKKFDDKGNEYWEARELMPLLGYTKWQNFVLLIKRAKQSCKTAQQSAIYHFTDTSKMIVIGKDTLKETDRKIKNYKLSRYACYLIAQNGDPSKKEIALAQTYFAIQTRKQEIFEQTDKTQQRLFIRDQVRDQNKKLFSTAKQAGVKDYAKFNNAGYVGLYNLTLPQVKKRKGIGKDDILDRSGVTELAANLFRITQTDDKISLENIKGEAKAAQTHYQVGQKVRQTIKKIGGIMPENLKPEPNIKKLESSQRKLLQ